MRRRFVSVLCALVVAVAATAAPADAKVRRTTEIRGFTLPATIETGTVVRDQFRVTGPKRRVVVLQHRAPGERWQTIQRARTSPKRAASVRIEVARVGEAWVWRARLSKKGWREAASTVVATRDFRIKAPRAKRFGTAFAVERVRAVERPAPAPPPPPPPPAPSPPPPPPATVVARWEMNESSGATVMVDSGQNGLDGTIGASVRTGIQQSGASVYRFPFVSGLGKMYAPERLVTVSDTVALDPQAADYSFTVRMRTQQSWVNVIQKGQSGASGGFWKLELDDGYAQCLFRGPEGSFSPLSRTRVDDGQWHTITCSRWGNGVAVDVDGVAVKSRSGWTGSINNGAPLAIAGKVACDGSSIGCDYFSGDIDWVRVAKG